MADERVNVIFGATTAELLAKIEEAKHAIEGFRAPIDATINSFRSLAEVTGIAFAVDKIRELATEMGELGEHAVNMGIALGTSAEQFQTLSEAMSLVGASADGLVRSQRMLERAAQTAVTDPMSRQADAFRALHVDAKAYADLLQTDLVGAMKLLADAAVKTGNASATGALGAILGRGGNADLFRFYSEGAAGIDKLIDETKKLGAPTQTSLESLAKFQESVNGLSVAFKNLGAEIVSSLSGPLTWFTDSLKENYSNLTDWVRLLRGSAIQPGPGAAGRGIFGDMHDIAGASPEELLQLQDIRRRESSGDYSAKNPKSSASGAYQMIDETWRRWAQSVGINIERYPTARDAPMAMQDVAALHGLRTEGTAPWRASEGAATHLPDVEVTGHAEAAAEKQLMINTAAIKKERDEKLKALDEEFSARQKELDLEVVGADQNRDKIAKIEKQKNELAAGYAKDRARIEAEAERQSRGVVMGEGAAKAAERLIEVQKQGLVQEQRANAERVAVAMSAAQAQIKALDLQERAQLSHTQHLYSLGQLTAEEAASAEREIVLSHAAATAQILAAEEKLAGDTIKLQQEVANRRLEADQKTADDITKIDDKLALERHKTWTEIGDSIAGSLDSAVNSVIEGTATIGAAFRRLGLSILEEFINLGIKKAITSVFDDVFSAVGGGAAGAAGGGGGGIFGTIFKLGATVLGGLFGGPAGAAGGAAIAEGTGGLYARGGIVPSAARGWSVPSYANGGIPSILHGGEMVLPEHISTGLQSMINGGGGGGIHFHATAMDSSFARMVSGAIQQNPSAIKNLFKSNALTPRTA